jgi:hypothetical protein
MKRKYSFGVNLIIVVCFLLVSLGFFYVIYWADFPKEDIKTQNVFWQDENLTFRGEVKRFLDVYFTQEFATINQKLDFIRVEGTRFANYPLTVQTDIELRQRLLENLSSIIIKSESENYDFSAEDQKLSKLLEEII